MGILKGKDHAPWETPLAWVLWAVLLVAAAVVVYTLKNALLPFLLAFVFAYVFAPWVDRLEKWKLPRPLGTSLVFVGVSAFLSVLVLTLLPVLERQVSHLFSLLPGAFARLKEVGIPFLSGVLPEMPQSAQAWLDTLAESAGKIGPTILGSTSDLLKWAASGTLGAVIWVLSAAIVPVLAFYLMMDYHRVTPWLLDRMPDRLMGSFRARLTRIDTMLGEFLRGQLTVAVILSGLYAGGLTLAGVEAALAIGLIAGLGNMVPYLGFVVGITLSLAIAFLTHFDLIHLLYVVLVFGVVQTLEGVIISPKVVGDRVGLHPVAIIFALFVGGEAFGFLGVLLGVPAAIAVKVLIEPEPA